MVAPVVQQGDGSTSESDFDRFVTSKFWIWLIAVILALVVSAAACAVTLVVSVLASNHGQPLIEPWIVFLWSCVAIAVVVVILVVVGFLNGLFDEKPFPNPDLDQ